MIRVSSEHGVNPSVGLCYFCNEPKEVVLLGALSPQRRDQIFGPELSAEAAHEDVGNSAAAPRQAVYNMEPCAKCEEYMRLGIICISVDPVHTTDKRNPHRTGGWAVVREEAVQRALANEAELLKEVLAKRVMFIEDEVWLLLGLPPLGN